MKPIDLSTWTPAAIVVISGFFVLAACLLWYVTHNTAVPEWMIAIFTTLVGGGSYGVAVSHINGLSKKGNETSVQTP